jgi:hypothetical protein
MEREYIYEKFSKKKKKWHQKNSTEYSRIHAFLSYAFSLKIFFFFSFFLYKLRGSCCLRVQLFPPKIMTQSKKKKVDILVVITAG